MNTVKYEKKTIKHSFLYRNLCRLTYILYRPDYIKIAFEIIEVISKTIKKAHSHNDPDSKRKLIFEDIISIINIIISRRI